MPVEKVEIKDYEAWGRLVKTWATGANYLVKDASGKFVDPPVPAPAGANAHPRPTSIDEFKSQAINAGAIANTGAVPASITSIAFVQGDMSTLVIRLPAPGRIAASEAAIASGDTYELSPIYQAFAFGNTQPNIANPLIFNHMSIGDYTIRNCM